MRDDQAPLEFSQRRFGLSLAEGIGLGFHGAKLNAQQDTPDEPGRMRARAVAPVEKPAAAGLHPLKIRSYRDTLVYIPEAASKFAKVPVVLSLHGATQGADRGISLLQKVADEYGFMIVASASAGGTWEICNKPQNLDKKRTAS